MAAQQERTTGRRRRRDPGYDSIEVRAPVEMIQAFRDLARENERPVAGELRLAMRSWLAKQPGASHGS